MRNLGFRNIRNRGANAGISTVDLKTLATLNPKSYACLEKNLRICPSLLPANSPYITHLQRMKMGQDSAVGIATRYGLGGPGMDSC
jgi:hypothetical protein